MRAPSPSTPSSIIHKSIKRHIKTVIKIDYYNLYLESILFIFIFLLAFKEFLKGLDYFI